VIRQTGLHLAAWDFKTNEAKSLLQRGAKTNVKDAEGFIPTGRARLRWQRRVEKALLDAAPQADLANIFKDQGNKEDIRGRSMV